MAIARRPRPAPGAALSDDDIHQRLVEAIVDQRLVPGTRLGEDKLGQAFGVSRTRIRQVLIRLAQEQVVTLQPNKGASIAEPSVDEAREVFEARSVVESVLVRRFIQRATASDLKALADCIDQEEAARRSGDAAMALRQSGRFHLLLADAAGHQTFASFLRRLVSRTSLILMSYAPAEDARVAGPRWIQVCRCEEHRGLLTALRQASRGRAEEKVREAVALMTEHLAHIEGSLCFDSDALPELDLLQTLAQGGR